MDAIEGQNKTFFQLKARELIEREKEDYVTKAQANLLFQKLNMSREQIFKRHMFQEKTKAPPVGAYRTRFES